MKAISKNIHSNAAEEFREILSDSQGRSLNKKDIRLGLILEGGALRGILSCSYAIALKELTSIASIQSIYGSSSGGLNAVYFATNELRLAKSIYVENATDKRCTSILNFPNVLNVDWLVDNWIFGAKAFNKRKLKESTAHVIVSLTDMSDGHPIYAELNHLDDAELVTTLKSTSYAPLLTNSVGWLNGVEVGDGAIGDALLFDKAVDDGCTHIICLLTRPQNYRKGKGNVLSRIFKKLRLLHRTSAYRQAFFEAEHRYNEVLDRIYSANNQVPTLVVCPADTNETPSNLETKSDRILQFSDTAYNAAKTQLAAWLP